MEISQITEIIIAAAPAITAIIGIIVSMVTAIKNIKSHNSEIVEKVNKANDDALAEIKAANKELLEAQQEVIKQNLALQAENQELKDLTKRTLERLNKVRGK